MSEVFETTSNAPLQEAMQLLCAEYLDADSLTMVDTYLLAEQLFPIPGVTPITTGERALLSAWAHILVDNPFVHDDLTELFRQAQSVVVVPPKTVAELDALFMVKHTNWGIKMDRTCILFDPEDAMAAATYFQDARAISRSEFLKLLSDPMILDARFIHRGTHGPREADPPTPGDRGLIDIYSKEGKSAYAYLYVEALLLDLAIEIQRVAAQGRRLVLVDIGISKGTFLADVKARFPGIVTLGTTASLLTCYKTEVDRVVFTLIETLPPSLIECADYLVCNSMTSGYFLYDDMALLNMVKMLTVGGVADVCLAFNHRSWLVRNHANRAVGGLFPQNLGYGNVVVSASETARRTILGMEILRRLAAKKIIQVEIAPKKPIPSFHDDAIGRAALAFGGRIRFRKLRPLEGKLLHKIEQDRLKQVTNF